MYAYNTGKTPADVLSKRPEFQVFEWLPRTSVR